jgi:tetratricopeptide (TPR) repeat protein
MYFAKIFLIGFLLFFLKYSARCETSFEYYYSLANYYSESNLDSCIYYSKKAYSFAKTYEDSLKALNSQIGSEYLNQDFEEIKITLKAIEKTLNGNKEICFLEEVYAYNNLGVIYSLQGRFEDSFKWHIRLLAVIENFSLDNLFRLNIYLNIGKVLLKIGDFDSAITILDLSLKFSTKKKYLEQKNEALMYPSDQPRSIKSQFNCYAS